MSELQADYITRQRMADEGERAAQRAAEAMRFEKQMVTITANVILNTISSWNQDAKLDENTWRCVIQDVYERIGEAVKE